MHIYLPVAGISADVFLLLSIGLSVGILSGMFGVGGGFLITPLLFFIGIPPAVAVATSANQIVASSFSGVLAHWRRRTVDVPMGLTLMAGGLAGAFIGVWVFNLLKEMGQVDLMVRIFYVVFLGIVGALMFVESLGALMRGNQKRRPPERRARSWVQRMPMRVRYKVSGLYISVFPPLMVGFVVGLLSAIMGVGGGFIMVPAMIYLLHMPTKVVVGTSLLQIIVVAGFTTLMHAEASQTVDVVLAVILLIGGVVGAQLGTRIGLKLRAEQLRIALAGLVLAVCIKVALELAIMPAELYNLSL